MAKKWLAEGDFKQAVTAIEQGNEESKALLFSLGIENVDLHKIIAPFHYLNGITLLYSIEESNDTQATVSGAAQQTTLVPAAAAASTPQEEEKEAPADAADNADDMHIAWENLEVAQTIVKELLTQDTVPSTSPPNQNSNSIWHKFCWREGGLQWPSNGRYSEAIQDYQACLKLRVGIALSKKTVLIPERVE